MTEQVKKPDFVKMVNDRRLFGGEKTDLMAISPMKHKWAREFWDQMLANNWTLKEVDFTNDVNCYKNELTDAEREMVHKAWAFLSNLDGIQLHNLTDNIAQRITSPEVRMVVTRQAYEEALHVDAYSAMIEAFHQNPMEIYMTYLTDDVLAKKNDFIMQQSRLLKDDGSRHAEGMSIVANVALEGIYFYMGFLSFYTLGRRGKMLGCVDNIKFINRDEVTHLRFFLQMWKTFCDENPGVVTPEFLEAARQLLRMAVELEIFWGKYITAGVLGFTDAIIEGYVKTLGNRRSVSLGLGELYPNVKNPCEWVDDFSMINKSESNFFETKSKAYQVGTLAW